jgi:ATP-dependent Clp protease adapter protein ClpS
MNDENTGDYYSVLDFVRLIDEAEKRANKPPQYTIVLHNDYTSHPMIVVHVLLDHLRLPKEEAEAIVVEAHTTGKAVCGIFTKDVAETLVAAATVCSAVIKHAPDLTLTVEQEQT